MSLFSRTNKRNATQSLPALTVDAKSLEAINPQTVGEAFAHLTSDPLFPYLGSAPNRDQIPQAYAIIVCSKLLQLFAQSYTASYNKLLKLPSSQTNHQVNFQGSWLYYALLHIYRGSESVSNIKQLLEALLQDSKWCWKSKTIQSVVKPLIAMLANPAKFALPDYSNSNILDYSYSNMFDNALQNSHIDQFLQNSFAQSLLLVALKSYLGPTQANLRNQLVEKICNCSPLPRELAIQLPNFKQHADALASYTHYQTICSIQKNSGVSQANQLEKLVTTILTDKRNHDFLMDINRKALIINGKLQQALNDDGIKNTPSNRNTFYTHLMNKGFASQATAQLAAQLTSQRALMEIFGFFKKELYVLISDDGLIIDFEKDTPALVQLTPISQHKFAVSMTQLCRIYPMDLMGSPLNNNNAIFINLHFHLEIELSTDAKQLQSAKGYFIVSHPSNNNVPSLQPGYQALQKYHTGNDTSDNKDQLNKEFDAITDTFAIGYQYE